MPLTCNSPTHSVQPDIEHFNYDILESGCHCSLCDIYRSSAEDLRRMQKICVDHKWRCTCQMCLNRNHLHLVALAHSNRRDVYCELSFLTHDKRDGAPFMSWVFGKIADPGYKSDKWWSNASAKRTLGAWIMEWANSSPVSGASVVASGAC